MTSDGLRWTLHVIQIVKCFGSTSFQLNSTIYLLNL